MKKKFIVFAGIFALVLSLSACGGGEKATEKGEEKQVEEPPLTDSEISSMYTNPAEYKGRKVELTGKVFSEPEYDGNDIYFQMWGDPENSERNTIVMYSGDNVELESEDYIKLSGYIQGTFEGENAFGGKITAPQIVAETLEISSYKDVMAPTISEIVLENPTQEQFGYSVTIDKIELAEKETRVYITVNNSGSDKFSLYSFNSVILQGGKQFGEEANYFADYPEVQTDLNVGVSTEGVFCFPAISNEDFQIILEGFSDNFDEQLEPFTFDITV